MPKLTTHMISQQMISFSTFGEYTHNVWLADAVSCSKDDSFAKSAATANGLRPLQQAINAKERIFTRHIWLLDKHVRCGAPATCRGPAINEAQMCGECDHIRGRGRICMWKDEVCMGVHEGFCMGQIQ